MNAKSCDMAANEYISDCSSINDHFGRTLFVGEVLLIFKRFFQGVIVSLMKFIRYSRS